MNTPAHVVLNLAVLAGGERKPQSWAVAAGALVCDAPMFLFYLWQRAVERASEAVIWNEAYFRAGWQDFFDIFNSIPVAAVSGLAAWRLGRPGFALFFASMLLHQVLDLPIHRDDAHRHFLPLTDWRFSSPVSYWDPAYHGALMAGVELALVVAASAVLWRRTERLGWRIALALLCSLQAVGWLWFYGLS